MAAAASESQVESKLPKLFRLGEGYSERATTLGGALNFSSSEAPLAAWLGS